MKWRQWSLDALTCCVFFFGGGGGVDATAPSAAAFVSSNIRRIYSKRKTTTRDGDQYVLPITLSDRSFISNSRQTPPRTEDGPAPSSSSLVSASSSSSALGLVPIRQYHDDDFTFLANSDEYRCCIDKYGRYEGVYELALVEEEDLPDVARFVVEAFGSDAIRLSQDIGAFEKMLMTPAVELVNGYSGIVAFAEVLAGLRSRLSFRIKAASRQMDLSPPNLKGLSRPEQISMAAQTSVVLALAKAHSDNDKDWHSDVIASIELRLQPCDAKIPFSLPWIDRIERFLASLVGRGKNNGKDLQPYLSNLCVDEKLRGKGIGRALVRCVENIAYSTWGYSRMYLHVDVDNAAALELYKSEGYRDVGLRWNPFWAGHAADIGYFVKNLDGYSTKKEDKDLLNAGNKKDNPKSTTGEERSSSK